MSRTYEQILTGLATLRAEDFDSKTLGSSGQMRLRELTDELMTLPQPERGVRALFDVMERMPDAELGNPGPIAHTLERMRGCYENELVESIKRKPSSMAIWLVNRILNSIKVPEQRQLYLDLLQSVSGHPTASELTRQEARHFVEFQTKAASYRAP